MTTQPKPQYTFHKGIPIPVAPKKPRNEPKTEGEGASNGRV